MNRLKINAGNDTPEVDFNPNTGKFRMKGKCHPENVRKFYEPILDWVEKYSEKITEGKHINFEIMFTYLNSASLKYLLVVIQRLSQYKAKNADVTFTWFYEKDDDDMNETASEFFEFTSLGIPFETKVFQNDF